MKLSKSALRALIAEELQGLMRAPLLEAEDDEKAADAGDDLFGGGDEGDDAGGDDKDADAGEGEGEEEAAAGDDNAAEGEDEADADSEKEEDEDSKEEEEEPEPEPTGPVGDEVDVALKDVMADFEKNALDAAAAKSKVKPYNENRRARSLVSLLFESDDDEVVIDVGTFAGDVARLIKNYDTLIDMEGVIYSKARDFLEKKYGSEYADQLDDILAREYDLEFDLENDPEKAEQTVYAVGASSSGGGA